MSTDYGFFSHQPVPTERPNVMKNILDIQNKNTLVILDLDDTTMRARTWLASEAYYHHMIDERLLNHWDEKSATIDVNRFYNQFQLASPQAVLADDSFHIGETIQALMKRGVKVIALTARESSICDITLEQLDNLGIWFSQDVLGSAEFIHDNHPIKVQNGVIYAGNLNKGHCLAAIEDHTPLSLNDYESTHFVDDRFSNCQAVDAYLKTRGLSYQVHHYPFVSEQYVFNQTALKIADYQARHFDTYQVIPSNEDVLAHLQMHAPSLML